MGFGVKIKVEDTIFSDLVRWLAGWKCVRCGRQHQPNQNTMDCSHYRGRGHKSTRFDLENADALCRYPCHQGSDSTNMAKFGWEYQKGIEGINGHLSDGAYTTYKKQQLGEERFFALYRRSNEIKKRSKVDIKELRAYLRVEVQKAKEAYLARL